MNLAPLYGSFFHFFFRFWLSSITLFLCFFMYAVEFSSLPTLGNSHHFSYNSFRQNPRLFVFILRRVGGVIGIMEPLPLSPLSVSPLSPSLLLLPAPSAPLLLATSLPPPRRVIGVRWRWRGWGGPRVLQTTLLLSPVTHFYRFLHLIFWLTRKLFFIQIFLFF